MKKIKILQIFQHKSVLTTYGGNEYTFFQLNYGLARTNNFEITIISPGYSPLIEKLKKYGIKVIYINFFKLNIFSKIKKLKDLIKKQKFDIIHTHELFSNWLVYHLFKNNKQNILFISNRYDIIYSEYMNIKNKILFKILKKHISKKIMNFNDFNICISNTIKEMYSKIGILLSTLKTINPAISHKNIFKKNKVEEIRKKIIGVNSNKIKIVCLLGAFRRIKNGFDIFCKIIEYIKKNNPEVPIKFAVFGDDNNKLKDYFKQKKLNNDVFVIENYFSPNDILNAIDISVLPYRFTDLPIYFIKSLKFHKPVIASDIGCYSQIIQKGKTGYICKVEDYKDFSKKIIEITNNYNTFIENYKNFELPFSYRKMISKYLDIYKNAF